MKKHESYNVLVPIEWLERLLELSRDIVLPDGGYYTKEDVSKLAKLYRLKGYIESSSYLSEGVKPKEAK